MSDDISPTLAEVIRAALDSRLLDLHTALPGRVVSYDSDAQTADIRPMVRRALRDEDGEKVLEDLPVVPKVPVQWPRGGGFFLSMPLAEGDSGLLVFSERSIDRWRSTGEAADPGDQRTHGLSGAVFIPGVFPSAGALEDASGTVVVLGRDGTAAAQIRVTSTEIQLGGAAAAIARADRVEAELTALKNAISGAGVSAGDGGAAFKAAILAALAAWPGSTGTDNSVGT